jgi:arylsulfatase A-like enzyme
MAAGVALPVIDGFSGAQKSGDDDRPNVIIIGIDSLRTDYVRNPEHRLTPALDDFFGESIQFSNALTPLARTFPAWVSIVSGRHPHTTRAVINLLPRDQIDTGQTLPSILAAAGYETVYSTDEVRFSNLDTTYGFNRLLAPPMGATDFVLGFFSDTPLSNVLVNTQVGKWLFPYAYANRAVAKTYDPDTFLEWIDGEVDFESPTFLAVHLTLTHWPYSWATPANLPATAASAATVAEEGNRRLYDIAVDRVDRQFGELMENLKRKGALENAIVIVLSDHGE